MPIQCIRSYSTRLIQGCAESLVFSSLMARGHRLSSLRDLVKKCVAVVTAALLTAVTGAQSAPACVGASACQIDAQAVEYRHKGTGVYFMTPCANEKTALDSLPDLFERSGKFIPVSTAAGTSGQLTGVSRFLFGAQPDPLDGTRTLPTRHFFTALPIEVNQLNVGLAQLNKPAQGCFEATNLGYVAQPLGISADTTVNPAGLIAPESSVRCVAGQIPIWRIFNERVPQHRMTSDYLLLKQILADTTLTNPSAWRDEGVKWCSPAITNQYSVSVEGNLPSIAAGASGQLRLKVTNGLPSATNAIAPVLRLQLPAGISAAISGYACATSGILSSGLSFSCQLPIIASSDPTLSLTFDLAASSSYQPNATLRATVAPPTLTAGEADPTACKADAVPSVGCLLRVIPDNQPPSGSGFPRINSLTFVAGAANAAVTNTLNITPSLFADTLQTLYLYAQFRATGSSVWQSAGEPQINPFQVAQSQNTLPAFTITAGSSGGTYDIRLCASSTAPFNLGSACGDNSKTVVSAAQSISFGAGNVGSSLSVGSNTLQANYSSSGQSIPAFSFLVQNTGNGAATGLTCAAQLSLTGITSSCSVSAGTIAPGASAQCNCPSPGNATASGSVTFSATAQGTATASSTVFFTVAQAPASSVSALTMPNPPVGVNPTASASGNQVTLRLGINNTGSQTVAPSARVFYAAASGTPNSSAQQANILTPNPTIPSGSGNYDFQVEVPANFTTGYFKICLLNPGQFSGLACGSPESKESLWSAQISFGPPPPPPASANVSIVNPPALAVGSAVDYKVTAVSASATNLVPGPLYLSVKLPANVQFEAVGSSTDCAAVATNTNVVQCTLLANASSTLPATVGPEKIVRVKPLAGAGGVAASITALVASTATINITCPVGTTGCKESAPLTPDYYDLLAPTATISLPASAASRVAITCTKQGGIAAPSTSTCKLRATFTDSTTLESSLAKAYVNGAADLGLCATGTTAADCDLILPSGKTVQTIQAIAASNETPINFENNLTNNVQTVYNAAPPAPTCTDQVSGVTATLDGRTDFVTGAIDATMTGPQANVIQLIPGQFMNTAGRTLLNMLAWDVRAGYAIREATVSPCKGDFTSSAAQVMFQATPDETGSSGGIQWVLDEPTRSISARTARIESGRNWYLNIRNTTCFGSSFGANVCRMYWFAIPAANR